MGRYGSDDGWGNTPRGGDYGSSPDNERRGSRTRMSASQISSALREAQQLQQEGRVGEAVAICEELLESGVDRADVHYFLGWLYQEADRWEDAASQFERLLEDPDYALSCYYALGQCERALGHMQEAARYFDEAVDRVNLDALAQEESDQLLQLCQEAAEAHRDMSDTEGAETIFSALLGYLRSQGWQEQVAEVERMMRETLGSTSSSTRRRRDASASRNISERIPHRAQGHATGSPAGPMGAESRLGTGNLLAGSRPGALPDDPNAGSISPNDGLVNDFANDFGGVMPGGGFDAGMGAQAPFGAPQPPIFGGASINDISQAAGAGGVDPLARIISSLTGPQASLRASLEFLPPAQRAQVTQAINEIENFIGHGLLTAAIEVCMRVMEIAPQYLDIHVLLGEIYVRQGKIEQATAKYVILADQYLHAGRTDDAIATYRRILQLEPNNLPYRVKLIELLSREGRLEEALTERMAAAEAYLRAGLADRATQEYEQAMLAWPNNMQLRLNYANALMRSGKAAQAVGEYQRVLQADPGNVMALARWQIALATKVGVPGGLGALSTPGASNPGAGSERVVELETLGRLLRALRAESFRSYDEITRDYVQALDQTPGSPNLRYALGLVHLAAGRQQEALTALQQMANTPGWEALARYALAQAYLLTGDATNAGNAVRELEDAAGIVRRNPPEPLIWAARPRADNEERLSPEVEVSMLLARAYQLSGQVAQGQKMLQTVSQTRARNDEVYALIAEVAARNHDPQAQLQEYAQLARQFRMNRQVENAVVVLREMQRLAHDDPAVHSELADIQINRGLLEEGAVELRALADIYTRRGALAEAAQVYQRLAEIAWTSDSRDDALNLLRQAIAYATDDMSLRHQFVQYCLEVGRSRDAVEQQTVIARYYFSSRQSREAVAALQQLIAMDKSNFEAYDLLGQTYYSVGEYEQAARVYRNLARVDPTNNLARVRLQELGSVRPQT